MSEDFPTQPRMIIDALPDNGDPSSLGGNLAVEEHLELIPGLSVPDIFLKSHTRNRTLKDYEIEDAKLEEVAHPVAEWLKTEGLELESRVNEARDPNLPERTVPVIGQDELALFTPKTRKSRKIDGVKFTTGKLIDALKPDESGGSFLKRLLPQDITIGAAMVLIDKDPRYRDVIAAACYRVLEHQAETGMLDSYERIKKNNTYKTVNHNDSAITKGLSRDVVVGMVLDMLSGRFNADEQRKSSEAMKDYDRDDRGVFRGGQHSGAAAQVLMALIAPGRYDRNFNEPYFTKQEKFQNSLTDPDFQQELVDPTLKLGTWEENSLGLGVEMITQKGDRKRLNKEVKDLIMSAGELGARPISLRQVEYLDEDGRPVKGVKVRRIREAGSVEFELRKRAEKFKISTASEEYKTLLNQLIAGQGYEFFVPEGVDIKIGRGQDSTIQIVGDKTISSDHCKIRVVDGRFIIEDTSKNGTKFKLSGPSVSRERADEIARWAAPTVFRPTDKHPLPEHEAQWRTFVNQINIERQEQKRLSELTPARRLVTTARSNFREVIQRRRKH